MGSRVVRLCARWRFGRVWSVRKQTVSIGGSACPIGCSWFCTCWPPCGSPGSRREEASTCEEGRETPSMALFDAPPFASPCLSIAQCRDSRPLRIQSDRIILHSQHSRHSPGWVKAAIHENTHLGSGQVHRGKATSSQAPPRIYVLSRVFPCRRTHGLRDRRRTVLQVVFSQMPKHAEDQLHTIVRTEPGE